MDRRRGAMRGWRTFLALSLVVTAGCRVDGVETLPWDGGAARTLDAPFSLLCWNVQKGKSPELVPRVHGLSSELAPDLIFLQEANMKVVGIDGYGGVFAPGWSYPWPGGERIGVAILSTTEPTGFEKHATEDREFLVTAPKVSLAATWSLPAGDTLLVVNTHCLAFESGERMAAYRRQLDGIEAVIAMHTGPVVLAGDVNTWNGRRLELALGMTARLGLTEVVAFDGDVPRTTADFGSDAWNRSVGLDPSLAIDRVFVRGLDVLEARVLDETASDHVPVFVRFDVRSRDRMLPFVELE